MAGDTLNADISCDSGTGWGVRPKQRSEEKQSRYRDVFPAQGTGAQRANKTGHRAFGRPNSRPVWLE